jgi:arsenate reductase-like glutaredoxin family protein
MNKIYHLSSCSTCKRIIKEIQNCSNSDFAMQDIKTNPISEMDLDRFYNQTNSYEALFNNRAQKYKLIKKEEKPSSDADFKALILAEYTYLKRPVIEVDEEFFIGNSKANVEALLIKLNCKKLQ